MTCMLERCSVSGVHRIHERLSSREMYAAVPGAPGTEPATPMLASEVQISAAPPSQPQTFDKLAAPAPDKGKEKAKDDKAETKGKSNERETKSKVGIALLDRHCEKAGDVMEFEQLTRNCDTLFLVDLIKGQLLPNACRLNLCKQKLRKRFVTFIVSLQGSKTKMIEEPQPGKHDQSTEDKQRMFASSTFKKFSVRLTADLRELLF
ncbi:unnamed protein product [Gongylonema pulchrum]|uniref:Uncharacterized protein n=1 Tax=Gongylonema pulchrum TaxID=637853 RepID=A0A183D109_9BILA|nr:unnamed protein product [Gongylonema pulchrum]